MQTQDPQRFQPAWVLMSVVLLVVYLGFFHVCMGLEYWGCVTAGFVGTVVWFGVCHLFRQTYISRFEYLIHQLVGLDILIEGFNPLHEGYGFYFCALGFWLVFLMYHTFGAVKYSAVKIQAETADAGLAR